MSEAFLHRPVMVDEVVELMRAVPPGVVVDATVGAGGHARALLEARPDLRLVGLDRDGDAIDRRDGRRWPASAGEVVLRRARFDEITTTLQELGHETGARGDISGALFDLGVSSPQLDRPERGFSYRADGPLDMRMDVRQTLTAADVVNGYAEDELARVLYEHGGERFARRIARAIVGRPPARHDRGAGRRDPCHDSRARPPPGRTPGEAHLPGDPHRGERRAATCCPARSTRPIDVLVPEGRCVVLAYHSGEDRIVKQRFTHAATGGCTCPPGLPCVCGAVRRGPPARPPRPPAVDRRGDGATRAARARACGRARSCRCRTVSPVPTGTPHDERRSAS